MGKPLNYNKNLLLSGFLFTIHNIEEAISTAQFILPSDIILPIKLPGAVPMIWSITLITIMGWGVVLYTVHQSNEESKRNVLTFLLFLFLFNAFIPHIAASVILRMYTPALISSVLVYVPYALWGIPKLYRQFIVKKQFYMVLIVGMLATLSVVVGLQRIFTLIFS